MYGRKRHQTALTNENLTQQFANHFDIVSRAIHIAHYVVSSGKESQLFPNNVASDVLQKMAERKVESCLPDEDDA